MLAYKIQIHTIGGWADLKSADSDDESQEYVLEVYKSKEEAIEEMNSIVEALQDDPNSYRVVNYLVPEETNLY
jgi:hypothetical protein